MFFIRLKNLSSLRRYSSTVAKTLSRPLSAVSQALKYNVGDKINGFTVKQVQEVSELHLAAVRLQHDNTGADYLHVARDDKNNVFSVALRTTPKDSSGAPHILEHLALCGSQQFPCRDPFFKMLNRSLSTFMNAFTGSDYTMYPFSTQNPKDFENLLRIYLDAVFFPCLREIDFRQEGWRLEHENVNDKNSPIILKGVVFNEMKGVFSDPNQQYAEHLQNKLFPSHAYSHVSGGNPIHIPNLTWSDLKKFHAEHYHPSNSRFYTYGDLPLESHLESVEEYVLKKFSKRNVDNHVKEEQRWTNPQEARVHCRFDPLAAVAEKQTTVSVSYLLNNIVDTYEAFALNIIGCLLVDGPNSPFYKSLLEPRIGADYSPATGYCGSLKQSFFSVGLREISEKDINYVQNIIHSTFDSILNNGFPKERIEGALHSIELSLKHQTPSFGLDAVMGVNHVWNHGGNPISMLMVNDHVNWFQYQLKGDPCFLQDKINEYFKQNSHKLTLIMTPDKDYEEKLQEKEQKLLTSKLASLSENDKCRIYEEGLELAKYQQTTEDVSCLPSLQISDVQKHIGVTPLRNISIKNVPLMMCEQPTNGVVYFKALAKIPDLPEDLFMLLPLFSTVVTKMGAGERDYKQFDQEAELKSGGLFTDIHIFQDLTNESNAELNLYLKSHCLQKNVNSMIDLWTDIFNRLHLKDMDRLTQLIKMSAAELAQGISYSGHLYSMMKASSRLSRAASIREKMFGLSQVSFMKKVAEKNDYNEIIVQLRTLSDIILQQQNLRCAINTSPSSTSATCKSVANFVNSVSDKSNELCNLKVQESQFQAVSQKTHFILPFAVNYLGKSISTVPYIHKDFASLKTAAKLLSSKFLHREIREKGGAYGGGATLSDNGLFTLYSYRDPNLSQTLQTFEEGNKWLIEGDYSLQDIDEAKLGVFSQIDKPIAPGSKGSLRFLKGITDDMKQKLREQLFDVKKEEIISATNRYLLNSKTCGVSLIGPEHEFTQDSSWTVHKE